MLSKKWNVGNYSFSYWETVCLFPWLTQSKEIVALFPFLCVLLLVLEVNYLLLCGNILFKVF